MPLQRLAVRSIPAHVGKSNGQKTDLIRRPYGMKHSGNTRLYTCPWLFEPTLGRKVDPRRELSRAAGEPEHPTGQ